MEKMLEKTGLTHKLLDLDRLLLRSFTDRWYSETSHWYWLFLGFKAARSQILADPAYGCPRFPIRHGRIAI